MVLHLFLWPLREQARSHNGSELHTKTEFTEDQLWERAWSGRRSDDSDLTVAPI
jgi:hypothetical protein